MYILVDSIQRTVDRRPVNLFLPSVGAGVHAGDYGQLSTPTFPDIN